MQREKKRGLCALLRDWRASEAGNITIELAFVVVMLSTMSIGLYDFGRVLTEQNRVINAASAGAQYGIIDLITVDDEAGMEQAARDDANDPGGDLDVVDARAGFCRCPESAVETTCDQVCADDNSVPMYVQVTVRNAVDLLFPYPGITSPITVEAVVLKRKR